MSLLRKTSTGFAKSVLKVTVLVILAFALFYGSSYAYKYGQKVFEAKGVEEAPGTDITVTIKNGTTVKQLGVLLEDYGLIEDDFIFYLQTIAFEYKSVTPGTYEFNTSLSGEEIIAILSAGGIESDEEETESEKASE